MGVEIDKILGEALLHKHRITEVSGEPSLASLRNGDIAIADVGGTIRIYARTGDLRYYVALTPVVTDTDFDFMDGTAFSFMDDVQFEFMDA